MGVYTGYMENTANVQYNSNNNNNPVSNPKETYRPSSPKSPDQEALPLPKRKRPRHALVAPSTQSYFNDDDGMKELVPTANEPRDLPLPPYPAYSAATDIPQANPSQIVSTEQHHGQLEQLDYSIYGADVSYEDYGGYDAV